MVQPPFDAEALIRLGRCTAAIPAPDGTWAAVAVSRLDADGAKYVSDLWRVPLDGSGPAVQLTRGPSDDRAPAFRRDGALGFLSNRNPREGKPEEGDDERAQVWILPAEGGEPRPLTDEPLGVSAFRFAVAGDRMVVIAGVLPGVPHEEQRKKAADLKKNGPSVLRYDRMPVRFWDQWLQLAAPHLIGYDERGGNRRDLTPEADRELRHADWDIAPDGRTLAVGWASPGEDRLDDTALVRIDLETGEREVLASGPRTTHSRPLFSPDGGRLAHTRHVREPGLVGKPVLCVCSLSNTCPDMSGNVRELGNFWDRWPVPHAWAEDGSRLVVTADDGGEVPVFTVDAASGAVTRISAEGSSGVHEGLSVVRGRSAAVGLRHTPMHPPEPFLLALKPGSEPGLVATVSGFEGGRGASIAAFESFTVNSDDGTPVQSFVYRPAGWKEGDPPLPTLIWIHGGPIGQWTAGWQWRWQPMAAVAAGYAVVLPNPRGSTGCGQAFIEGIYRNQWGGQCYRDLMAVVDRVEAFPFVDRTRIAAMGGSFGGYMTNWIGGNTDRFRCLVTHASLYHFPMFQGTTDFPVWFARQIDADPYREREAYDQFSPHARVDQWKSPVLIIHGERDYRVPIGESLALFEALQHHEVESELLVFPDENHWILKPRNIVAWYAGVLGFLGRQLG